MEMFGFGKSARIAELEKDVAAKAKQIKELTAEVAQTGVQLTETRKSLVLTTASRDSEYRINAHLRTEIDKLERDIAGLLPDAETYRAQKAKRCANLRQFRKAEADASDTVPATTAH
jgi:uncharacterized coiled-coil protein SlyX